MKTHKEKIDEMITLKKENSLWNHFLTNLFSRGEVVADQKPREYVIWTSNYWIGTFYPIFRITFTTRNEISKIETELSSFGKLCLLLLIAVILIFSSIIVFIPIFQEIEYFGLREIIILTIYSLFMYSLFWVMKKSYSNEKGILLTDLKIAVGLESQENIDRAEEGKGEWTPKMTLLRVFTYPFSIFVIVFSAFYLLPDGNLKGIFGILVCGTYLLADIRILIKKKKTKANN